MMILSIWSILLVVAVFITLVRNDYWIFKVMEYPRLQKLVMVLLTLATWYFFPPHSVFHWSVFVALSVAAVYLLYKIWPYTIFSFQEIKRTDAPQQDNGLSIFAANVYQDNRNYSALLSQVRSMNPDLVFLLETDQGWADAVKELEQEYAYSLRQPLDNTYGLMFYSRLPLKEGTVLHLVKNDIPSIEAVVQLPSGQEIRIWGLHPEPPVPGESLTSSAKDKELMKVALKVRKCDQPCIVFGDLNDVAWSHTTELFRKTSRLLDPRRGRGFYSTFSARSPLIRFPLDYIFCSKEFLLVEMRRMPYNGSDHFATFTQLAFQPRRQSENREPEADKKEVKEAAEMADQEVES
jgi:endonuclease/exonuclease/phosphatase (EEP) superfamily protein YafD